jgi:hypothetical protein
MVVPVVPTIIAATTTTTTIIIINTALTRITVTLPSVSITFIPFPSSNKPRRRDLVATIQPTTLP